MSTKVLNNVSNNVKTQIEQLQRELNRCFDIAEGYRRYSENCPLMIALDAVEARLHNLSFHFGMYEEMAKIEIENAAEALPEYLK